MRRLTREISYLQGEIQRFPALSSRRVLALPQTQRGMALAWCHDRGTEEVFMSRRRPYPIARSLAFMRRIVERLWQALDGRGIPGFRRRRRQVRS